MAKQDELLALCEKFIQTNHIFCPETIYQYDWVSESALQLIEDICNIVGYQEAQ